MGPSLGAQARRSGRACVMAGLARCRYPVEKERPLDADDFLRFAACGAACGCTAHAFLVPIDVVKTRMQSEPKRYPDMVSTFGTLVEEEVRRIVRAHRRPPRSFLPLCSRRRAHDSSMTKALEAVFPTMEFHTSVFVCISPSLSLLRTSCSLLHRWRDRCEVDSWLRGDTRESPD